MGEAASAGALCLLAWGLLAKRDAPNLCFGALLPAWVFYWLAWRVWLLAALPLLVFLCAALVHTASLVPLVLCEPVVLAVSQGAYVLWFLGRLKVTCVRTLPWLLNTQPLI